MSERPTKPRSVSPRNPLADPRRRRAEAAALEAERAWLRGEFDGARALFEEAAAIEERVARSAKPSLPRARGAVALGAVTLWHRAGAFERAKRTACFFLAQDGITDDARRELERLLDRCVREAALQKLNSDPGMMPVELKLDGGHVRAGVIAEGEARRRREVFASLLMRTAEMEAGIPHRERGESRLSQVDYIKIYEVPAIPSSYGLRFYVATGTQQSFESTQVVTPRRVIDRFLDLATAAAAGSDRIRHAVPDEQYAMSFIAGFAEIAPDGEQVSTVDCYAPSWRIRRPRLVFEPRHRAELRAAIVEPPLRAAKPGERIIDAVLERVVLKRDEAWIELEDVPKDLRVVLLTEKRMRSKAAALLADARVRVFARWVARARRFVVVDLFPLGRGAFDV